MKCALELFKRDRELYGEDSDDFGETKESEKKPPQGQTKEDEDTDRRDHTGGATDLNDELLPRVSKSLCYYQL